MVAVRRRQLRRCLLEEEGEEDDVDMEKIAYVYDNLYNRICDKIGRLYKENEESIPYEKNDNIVR